MLANYSDMVQEKKLLVPHIKFLLILRQFSNISKETKWKENQSEVDQSSVIFQRRAEKGKKFSSMESRFFFFLTAPM